MKNFVDDGGALETARVMRVDQGRYPEREDTPARLVVGVGGEGVVEVRPRPRPRPRPTERETAPPWEKPAMMVRVAGILVGIRRVRMLAMLASRPRTSSSSSSSSSSPALSLLLSPEASCGEEVAALELRPMGIEEKGRGVYQARARLSWFRGAVGEDEADVGEVGVGCLEVGDETWDGCV